MVEGLDSLLRGNDGGVRGPFPARDTTNQPVQLVREFDFGHLNAQNEWVLRRCVMARIEFRCCVCERPENECTCVKYCALCHGDYALRLTQDGQYYCPECREACEYKTQEQV